MATAKTHTLMTLDRWAQLVGLNPIHFNQVQLNGIEIAKVCGEPVFQYSWQNADRIGREEVAQAIGDAESVVHRWIGYNLKADWVVDERQSLYGSLLQRVRLDSGYVQYGGIQAKSLIDNEVIIVYTDGDTDGYDETATVTVATTVTDPNEICIYYPDKLADDAWEIRPTTVTISGGIATIVFTRQQAVIESLLEGFGDKRAVEGIDDANFLTTVDVYRRYTDHSTQVQYLWNGGCLCSSTVCQHATQNGYMLVRDVRSSIVDTAPSTYDAVTDAYTRVAFNPCRYPDSVRLWYKAGLSTYPADWERVVAYLAVAQLDRPLCSCNSLEKLTDYWAQDLAESTGETIRRIGNNMLDNPIGTKRAEVNAWNMIQKHMRGEAVLNVY